ncbi:CHAT domain-containing protein [Streptomyces sp. NPDC048507]|uniref:CHAT domain-containing protein n=1 Tax=Streptomyces sp. NPDC048507 TaxID=3365560 RepID=UPI0037207358
MTSSADQLRAEREAAMDALAALPAADPGAAELCGRAGELSYRLYTERGDPEDGELAAEAFAHAFRRPGEGPPWPLWRIMYGHLLALRHDEQPGPELAERARTLIAAGLAGLPGARQGSPPAVLARWLLAFFTKLRAEAAPEDPALLDEALSAGRAALDDTDGQDADLLEALGFLWQRHGDLTCEAASYERSARAYATVLDGAAPGRDLPLVRQSRGASLIFQGYQAGDRALLEEGRRETLRALAEAGDGTRWAQEARLRVALARAMIAGTWADEAQGERAEAELAALLTTDAARDALPWPWLDVFGRFLAVRFHQNRDLEVNDLAIALLTRALDRRQEARTSLTPAALALATAQHLRYERDQDPGRLTALEGAAQLALEGDELPAEVRDLLLLMLSEAQDRLGPSHPRTVPAGEITRVYRDFQQRVVDGAAMDFGFVDPYAEDSGAPGSWERRFSEVFDRWRGSEPGPGRAETAAHLLVLLPVVDPNGERAGEEREAELTAAVRAHADLTPAWRGVGYAVLGNFRFSQGVLRNLPDRYAEAVEFFAEAVAAGNDNPWVPYAATVAAGMLAQLRGITGDSALGSEEWERLRAALVTSPQVDRMLRLHQAMGRTILAAKRGDLADADRQLAEVTAAVAEWPAGEPSWAEAWGSLETARMARQDVAARAGARQLPPPAGRPSGRDLRRIAAGLPARHRAAVLGSIALAWSRDALLDSDVPRIRECLALAEEAISLTEPGGESWIRLTSYAGTTYAALAAANDFPHSAERARDLERAITLTAGATDAMGGPAHRLWALSAQPLGRALRDRGGIARRDRERGRRLGLEAMRGFVWSALLQSGTQDVAESARLATEVSEEVIAWCLADRVPREAVQALDACRGLVLHTATTTRSVPELLTAAGHERLADEWRAAGADPDEVPGELRRRVVLALDEGGALLLDPPAPEEIGAALRAQHKDALVYLVPATAHCPGAAVVVTATGEVHDVPLPDLRADAPALRAYHPQEGRAPRDLVPALGPRPARPAGAPPLREQLDRLCSWAWRAALRPLLGTFQVPDRPGRVPRLVLVPMGVLGLVPWHAAFTEGASGRRYALQEAEISYAASARLLCEVAARPAVPHTGTALIVGNPTGDLPYAGEEADAVRSAFYPDAAYLGVRTGDGTPGQVADWLREHADGGAVLHLACHGTVEENRPRSAYLSLRDGVLTAEELSGATHGPLGLVVLAACRSQVSGRGHNEAYSLSSAFLVAGTRSVIGSLWPVPDDATSLLMFLTHHYLRREQEPPARALRRAQLWMLDPARTAPAAMPPALAARLAVLDPHDLSAWAGFTHLGQ